MFFTKTEFLLQIWLWGMIFYSCGDVFGNWGQTHGGAFLGWCGEQHL